MEESKAKTAEEILKECTGHAHGLTDAMHIKAMEIYADQLKSNITKLEVRNKELEEQVAELKDDLSLIHNYTKTHIKDSKVLVIISKVSSKHLSK